MKIWFDISNSPQVLLFEYLITDLTKNGHQIIVTSRPLANTIDLLNQKNINHITIGKHYGKNNLKKLIGYPIRVFQLYFFLRNLKIHLAISQSSFHSPLVALLLRIPSIYTNDNEHALGNYIAFLFANKILIPDVFPINKLFFNSIISNKVIKYPGIKEGIYLWNKKTINHKKIILNQSNFLTIYFRPEPQTAQYYSGNLNFLDEIIIQLQDLYKVIILTRNESQYTHYNSSKFNKCYTTLKPFSFDDIIIDCNLFIGAGGTMTRELALLEIPTISVYQDDLLEVDKLLIKNELLIHSDSLSYDNISDLLTSSINKSNNSVNLLESGKIAYELFKTEILKFS